VSGSGRCPAGCGRDPQPRPGPRYGHVHVLAVARAIGPPDAKLLRRLRDALRRLDADQATRDAVDQAKAAAAPCEPLTDDQCDRIARWAGLT
jgi:hypothetical protein